MDGAHSVMERLTEAYEVFQELQQRFPKEKYISEVAIYAPEIRSALVQTGPDFSAFTSEQCDIPLIANRYPECQALVAAASVKEDEAIAVYQEIVAQYPESAHAHHTLGQLLVKQGKQKKLSGGIIYYENLELINDGLAHYKKTAELVGNQDIIFQEIGEIFHNYYHDSIRAFLFLYNGRIDKNTDAMDGNTAIAFMRSTENYCYLEKDGYVCDPPSQPEEYSRHLIASCTENLWKLYNCSERCLH